jgi:hypothetical protein
VEPAGNPFGGQTPSIATLPLASVARPRRIRCGAGTSVPPWNGVYVALFPLIRTTRACGRAF